MTFYNQASQKNSLISDWINDLVLSPKASYGFQPTKASNATITKRNHFPCFPSRRVPAIPILRLTTKGFYGCYRLNPLFVTTRLPTISKPIISRRMTLWSVSTSLLTINFGRFPSRAISVSWIDGHKHLSM